MTKQRIFAVCRPYGEKIRARVFRFLESMRLTLGRNMLIAPGTPDDEAATALDAMSMDLLLMPFHLHRDRDGNVVDGLGVLERVSPDFIARRVPILMPVSAFSQRASFPRRLGEVAESRPEAVATLVSMTEAQIGAPDIRTKLERLLAR